MGERGPGPATIVWELRSGTVVVELRGHKGGVATIAWSPDGAFLATVTA